jgi:hypothetical protein
MIHGSDWNVNAYIKFNDHDIISFYDEDLIRNLSNNSKTIRKHVVEENAAQQGTKNVSFILNNANYIVLYEII